MALRGATIAEHAGPRPHRGLPPTMVIHKRVQASLQRPPQPCVVVPELHDTQPVADQTQVVGGAANVRARAEEDRLTRD
eukprot:8270675-Lingulodinium_polyedra.AAC.1